MSSKSSRSPADVGDRHRTLVAFALIAIGVGYAARLAGHAANESAGPYLDWITIGGFALAVAFVVPMFVWKLRNRSVDLRDLYHEPDGFVAETVRRAQKSSWEATFVMVMLLAPLDETIREMGLPPEFFLELVAFVMAGVFGVTFLALDRVEEGRPADEIEDVHGA